MDRLKITNLTKNYGKNVKALDDVSLSISNGMFGLLGPNGAGKSSLMRTLATLQEPDSGQVFFDGVNIHDHSRELRTQLGYLPQDFGVYPNISAVDLLNHLAILKGMRNPGERKEQVLSLLQQTNLFEVRKRAVSAFSGGMKQRFGIAQALLGNPQLLIVDEPTAGLDPQERNRFHDLLSEIGEGVVVILSTHIVEDVYDLCPEMAVLANGKVILRGKPSVLTKKLEGRIWHKIVPKEAVAEYKSGFNEVSARRIGGKIQMIILADSPPENGFEPYRPGLEEAYLTALSADFQAGKEDRKCS